MKKIPSLESLRAAQQRPKPDDTTSADEPEVSEAPAVLETPASLADPVGGMAGAEAPASLADPVGGTAGSEAPASEEVASAGAGPGVAAPRRRRQPAGVSPSKQRQRRRYSRERLVQALYQWDVGQSSATEVRRYFLEQQDMSRADIGYFEEAFRGVTTHPDPIDSIITTQLDRGFDELDPVERAILRLGVWELRERLDMPVGVVINEAIEVSKRFGAEQGHRYVNGVLDAAGKQLRTREPQGAEE